MDDKNDFLNAYKKKLTIQPKEAEQPAPADLPAAAPATPAAPEVPAAQAAVAGPAPAAGSTTGTGTSGNLHFDEKSGFMPVPQPWEKAAEARRRSRRLMTIVWLAVLAALLTAAGLFWNASLNVEVASLTGWSITDAQLWASENDIRLQVSEAYNDTYDADKVAAQGVAAGTRLRKGDFLPVVVSLGHDLTVELALPDLMAMSKTEIETWIAANFMAKVRITAEYSSTVAAGKVIRYEINDVTVVDKVKRSTPVYVIMSKGPEELAIVKVTVPNFKEKTVAQSYTFANENGLTLQVAEAFDDYAPNGQIIAQSIKANDQVDKGAEITITVSKGRKIVLPDFAAYTKARAAALANELGITVATADKYSGQAAGAFLAQSLEAGSVYASGDVLELTYSLGNQVVVSSFVGQPMSALANWAKGLNDQGAAITLSATYTQSNAAKDTILYQSKANTTISTTVTIYITVSRGKALFVPDFVAPEGASYDTAMTRDKALAICASLNIVPVFVAESKAGRLPGEIWYQSVAAGKEIYEGSTVTLKYVPANVTLSVPDFTGLTRQTVLDGGWPSQLTITYVTADTPRPDKAGLVASQSLAAGTTVAAGTAITLTVYPNLG